MGPGTKNRMNRTAETCRTHLRTAYAGKAALVEEFILEIEGHDQDVSRWTRFTNPAHDTQAMIASLDDCFGRWLRGEP